MKEFKIVEGVSVYPLSLYYLENIDKKIPRDKYKPVSHDQWLMLKELEPTKFGFDYKGYVELKRKQYEQETEHLKNATLKLESMMILVDIRPQYDTNTIDMARNKIKEVQKGKFFQEWIDPVFIDSILNLTV